MGKLAVAIIVSSWVIPISILVNRIVPHPYMIGALAVLIRQTNIVWILFVACAGIIDYTRSVQTDKEQLDDSSVLGQKNDHLASDKNTFTGPNLRRRRFRSSLDSSNHSTPKSSSSSHSSVDYYIKFL